MGSLTDDILRALRARAFMFGNEAELQEAVGVVLTEAGIEHEREVVLSRRDRIDFLAGSVGIECKIDHGRALLLRQVHRYAYTGKLSALVVVVGKALLSRLPDEINGVPVHVVNASRAF